MVRYFVLILLFSKIALAQTPEPVAVESESVQQIRERLSWAGHLQFSAFDMLVPYKFGASVSRLHSPGKYREVEYLAANHSPLGISALGTFKDVRISALFRNFNKRNSFNTFWGLSVMSTSLEFGSELASKVTGTFPYGEAFHIDTLGLQFGLGNEWLISVSKYAVPLRVDWFSITQPVWVMKREAFILDYINDAAAREALDTVMRISAWVPHIMLLKVSAGFAF
jgi:hypothetical protein